MRGFLYSRVQETVQEDLPREVAYLESHDQFVGACKPCSMFPTTDLTCSGGFCSKAMAGYPGAREFASLTNQEAETIEKAIEKMFREAVALGQPDS